jgi:hypothetical protein
MKMNISISDKYRLTSDGERNYMLEELVTIDPTLAPNYTAPKDGSTPPIRQEWRNVGRYWPINSRGLASAIEYAIHLQALSEEPSTLGAFVQRLHELRDSIHVGVGVGD